MSTTQQTWAFLKELIQRFFAKSPKFFKIIQVVSMVAFVVTGLPDLIAETGIVLPDYIVAIQNKVIAVASIVSFIISKLTVVDATQLPLSGRK
jgi:hypothetical protein